MRAYEKSHEEVVRILLSAGAKVDLQNEVSSYQPSPRICGDLYSDVRTINLTTVQGHVYTIEFITLELCTCMGLSSLRGGAL